MRTHQALQFFSIGLFATLYAACAAAEAPDDEPGGTLRTGQLIAAVRPSGTLQAPVVEIASSDDLLDAVTHNNTVYIHAQADGSWFFKSGNYLLGIESFTQYSQEWDAWIDFGSGDKV